MLLSAPSRYNSAHDVGAIGDGLLRMEGSFLAGESLHDQSSIFVYQYAHRLSCYAASLTTFCAASSISCPTVKFRPESTRICRPSSTLVPSMRTTIGTCMLRSRAA